MEEKRKGIKVKDIISFILIAIILFLGHNFYRKYNFNNFVKAEGTLGVSVFERDNTELGQSGSKVYKIINKDYNDAVFYETITVKPNTPYRVKCKIKTENVESKSKNSDSGAHISVVDTYEKSNNVIGTTEWTEVTLYLNSKNRDKIDIGFRLGGFEDECIGTAYFKDFSVEAGIVDESNTWNFLCLLFNNVDMNLDADGKTQNIKLRLTSVDKDDISTCMQRFKSSLSELSSGKIKANYDILEVNQPITQMSYDEENGYFVSGNDIKEVLDPFIEKGKYDHIFVCFRTGDINNQGSIPVNDWIGLGYMEYRNIGFSNIRLPDDDKNYVYKYDTRVNTFPEEVLLHEFLHTLERNAEEYGEERPALHDNEIYGYKNKQLIGLKEWYRDYMNKTIKSSNGNIGLPEDIYTKKPAKTTDFEYTHKIEAFKEPQNIIEEIQSILKKIGNMFSIINKNKTITEKEKK